jgi:hypothetical protein
MLKSRFPTRRAGLLQSGVSSIAPLLPSGGADTHARKIVVPGSGLACLEKCV